MIEVEEVVDVEARLAPFEVDDVQLEQWVDELRSGWGPPRLLEEVEVVIDLGVEELRP